MMHRKRWTWIVTVLVGAGAAMILAGAADGEMQLVYQKAARVCLECIGIG